MNSKRKTVNDIVIVTISNIITIVAGIVAGFLLPILFSVEEYGYYKTFTLYTGYMGLLNLGIADGIVLRFGGYDFDELDKEKFRSYFKWFAFVHFVLCGIMVIVGLFLEGEGGFILIALGVNTIIINTVGFFQQISQFTQRFKEFSMRKIIQGCSQTAIVGIIFLINISGGKAGYHLYLVLSIAFSVILSIWYFTTYKEIVFGKSKRLLETANEIIEFIRSGFPLLFANLCSTLILTLDRQFVNILFDKTEYAIYAFAYSMLSLVTVATSAVSTVLFPTLKRASRDNLHSSYSRFIGIMLVFVFGAMLGYYPLYIFISLFLPKYIDSLIIFRIIFPGLAISSCVTVIMHNFYKVLDKNLLYFKKGIVVLVLSAVTNGVAFWIFRTTTSISIASILTMIFWYIYVERMFVEEYQIDAKPNLIYILVMGLIFYSVTLLPNIYLSCLLYVFIYCVLTIIIKKDVIMEIRQFFKQG